MGEFRDQPKVSRFGRNRVLTKPDVVGKQGVPARVHDAVEGGVFALGKRIVGILGCRLKMALNVDEGLGEFSGIL